MLAFLVPLQVIDRAEAIDAGATLKITFVGLIVFQHMLPRNLFSALHLMSSRFNNTHLRSDGHFRISLHFSHFLFPPRLRCIGFTGRSSWGGEMDASGIGERSKFSKSV